MRGALDRLAHLIAGRPLPRKAVLEPPRSGPWTGVGPRRARTVLHEAVPASVSGAEIRWAELRAVHTLRLRALCLERVQAGAWSPSYGNLHLIAIRRILTTCLRMGLIGREECLAAVDLDPISGRRELAGRMLDRSEIAAHLDACTGDGDVKAVRDAALLAVASSTGARRGELTGAALADWDPGRGLLLHGKGNRDRRVPLAPWVMPYLNAWLRVRGPAAGPLFTRCTRWGSATLEPISGQTVADVLADRARQAGTPHATPHDARRTFASALLDDPLTDIVTVQHLMGHQNVSTTARYDRRGERARAEAILRLPDPHARGGPDARR
jgi:integrase